MKWFEILVPRLPVRDLPMIIGVSVAGALIAGAYGIIHDQITFSIGPEYFTRFKFEQFAWADGGMGERVFVATIGFLATWWVGLIAGWILARRLVPRATRRVAIQKVILGFGIIFLSAVIFGVGGFLYGRVFGPSADYSQLEWMFQEYGIENRLAFMTVGYIHNAGYLGGVVGLVATFFMCRPVPASVD